MVNILVSKTKDGSSNLSTRANCSLAEWLKATRVKRVTRKGSMGSNPIRYNLMEGTVKVANSL